MQKGLILTAALLTSLVCRQALAAPGQEVLPERGGRPQNVAAGEARPAFGPPGGAKNGMPGRMRRPQLSKEQVFEQLGKKYGYSTAELEAALAAGANLRSLGYYCSLAQLSGHSLNEVTELSGKMTSRRVEFALGLTPGRMAELTALRQAEALEKAQITDARTARKLLAQGYTEQEIRAAAALAQAGGKERELQKLLRLKTAANSWRDVAAKAGVSRDAFAALGDKIKDAPVKKSGPGFAGIHYKKLDKAVVTSILQDNYGFSKEETGQYYEQGLDYGELDALCLYAKLADRPLAEIMKLREKYAPGVLLLRLGLTPDAYFAKCVQHQARRLAERMSIPQELTVKYMSEGYPMHYVNMSWLLAQASGRDFAEVITLKTPQNTWDDAAAALGLSREQSREVKEKIAYEFQRKYE